MLKISPLFSGSKGNCTLIQSDNTNILLDAGYSYRSIVRELEKRGLAPNDVDAIVITHEHGDHVGALPNWAKHVATPVYAPKPIADYVSKRAVFCEVYGICGSFEIGNVAVDVYECSHDASCCCGYRFSSGGSKFACVTDTGRVTDALVEFLTPCPTIMLESNHDEDMLLKGDYSYLLKQRILSDYGHLSNRQAAEVLKRLIGKAQSVILAHLSENNNTRELAFSSAVNMYAANGVVEGKDVKVFVAEQRDNEVSICID
ncbi:MAG: MBL fold metallo-hydrolase [Clostridiales bacterium]|nr:MBL fold metallo-hydrolase [Clostridiales bacterium]